MYLRFCQCWTMGIFFGETNGNSQRICLILMEKVSDVWPSSPADMRPSKSTSVKGNTVCQHAIAWGVAMTRSSLCTAGSGELDGCNTSTLL